MIFGVIGIISFQDKRIVYLFTLTNCAVSSSIRSSIEQVDKKIKVSKKNIFFMTLLELINSLTKVSIFFYNQ